MKWLSKVFGLLNLDEVHRLKTKKQALEESLADTATKPHRKAVVPSKEVAWAMDEGASGLSATGAVSPEGTGIEHHKLMDSYILGLARFHCTMEMIELQAWQTKTVSA